MFIFNWNIQKFLRTIFVVVGVTAAIAVAIECQTPPAFASQIPDKISIIFLCTSATLLSFEVERCRNRIRELLQTNSDLVATLLKDKMQHSG